MQSKFVSSNNGTKSTTELERSTKTVVCLSSMSSKQDHGGRGQFIINEKSSDEGEFCLPFALVCLLLVGSNVGSSSVNILFA